MPRRIATLVALLLAASAFAQTRPHPYDLQHVRWHVILDDVKKTVVGDVTNVVKPKKGVSEIWFDSGELKVSSVAVDGQPTKFITSGGKLYLALPATKRSGKPVSVRVKYSGKPRSGSRNSDRSILLRSKPLFLMATSKALACSIDSSIFPSFKRFFSMYCLGCATEFAENQPAAATHEMTSMKM